jgi:WD40 repeat protein/mono/diheme cytochrome c family protein
VSGVAIAIVALLAQQPPAAATNATGNGGAPAPKPVSFYKEIRPLLTAQCAGCHQPAKAGGKVVLTSHAATLASKRHDESIVVAGKPDESQLLEAVLPRGSGDSAKPPKMPKGRPALSDKQVDLLRRWIAEGALDDTPAAAAEQFTMDRPPVYRQQPVVTALDFSPDGKTLAVSGYHEVFLYQVGTPADAGVASTATAPAATAAAPSALPVKLAARLVGMSERIQSAVFSPDGSQLLVVGGSPARFGEVQLWDVSERKLRLSIPVGSDTLYGGSWSPDGKRVAFGGGDTSVRALDVEKGEPVFFNAASEDLALDTAWSTDGSHLVSVGRDRALKLFEVATQQFVDNVTSITPGALKGGLQAVDRHPTADTLLIGGSDGTPKTYMMYRKKDRQIGDDYNLIKAYAPLAGRIFAAEWSADATRFVVAASNDGKGEVRVYAADQEQPVWSLPTGAPIYAATWRTTTGNATPPAAPTSDLIAAGGFDGRVVLIDAKDGHVIQSFDAAPTTAAPSSPQ